MISRIILYCLAIIVPWIDTAFALGNGTVVLSVCFFVASVLCGWIGPMIVLGIVMDVLDTTLFPWWTLLMLIVSGAHWLLHQLSWCKKQPERLLLCQGAIIVFSFGVMVLFATLSAHMSWWMIIFRFIISFVVGFVIFGVRYWMGMRKEKGFMVG